MSKSSVVTNASQSMTETLGRLVDTRVNIRCGFRPRHCGGRDNRSCNNVFAIGYRRYMVSPALTFNVQKHTHEGQYAEENRQHT